MEITFTPDLETGNPDVDRQHRVFFALADRMLRSGELDRDPLFAAAFVRFLARYAEVHFRAEELAMVLAGFPGKERHARAHDVFRREVESVWATVELTGWDRKQKARVHFLIQDWFVQHIRSMDADMAAHLRTKAADAGLPDMAALKAAGAVGDEYDDVVVVQDATYMSAAEAAVRRRMGR